MKEVEIILRSAQKQDAGWIADGIMAAVGDELVDEIANGYGRNMVKRVFTELAEMENSQYSYRNSIIAETPEGEVAGIVVAYDGKILIEARRLFFKLAKDLLHWDIYDMVEDGEPEVETDPSEFYLDSLAVRPQFRNHGVATKLIKEVEKRAAEVGKPVGLLCAEHNDTARPLYEKLGFKEIGKRPFAGELMSHMVKVSLPDR